MSGGDVQSCCEGRDRGSVCKAFSGEGVGIVVNW